LDLQSRAALLAGFGPNRRLRVGLNCAAPPGYSDIFVSFPADYYAMSSK